ncbi:hypothetical protein LINPERPRIM_LOCUS13203 [Linum perenne]
MNMRLDILKQPIVAAQNNSYTGRLFIMFGIDWYELLYPYEDTQLEKQKPEEYVLQIFSRGRSNYYKKSKNHIRRYRQRKPK